MKKYVVINDECCPEFSVGELVAVSYLKPFEWAKLYYSLSSGKQQVMLDEDVEELCS